MGWKDRDLISSLLSGRDAKSAQAFSVQKKREREIDAEYNRLITPAEKALVQEKTSKELESLLDNFAKRAGRILKTSFTKKKLVDWGKEKEEILKLFHQGQLKVSDATVEISYYAPVTDINSGKILRYGNEPQSYYFGTSNGSDNQHVKVSLPNYRGRDFDGSQDSLEEIANHLADLLDVRTLHLDPNDRDTPETRLMRHLSSAFSGPESSSSDNSPSF